jgi:putative FmdB family regulatory protein
MVVDAARAQGPRGSFLGVFGIGPKWTIQCGACGHTFRERIPMIDAPTVQCPACRAENRLNVQVVA